MTSYTGVATDNTAVNERLSLLAQTADVASWPILEVPQSGLYRVSVYAVVTRAATTSSVLPFVSITATDVDSGVTVDPDVVTNNNEANVVGTVGQGSIVVSAKQGTAIVASTGAYASAGAVTLQYNIHTVVEFLG